MRTEGGKGIRLVVKEGGRGTGGKKEKRWMEGRTGRGREGGMEVKGREGNDVESQKRDLMRGRDRGVEGREE